MRRILLVLTAVFATAAIAVPAAFADSPHYVKGPTATVEDNSLASPGRRPDSATP